MGFDFGSLSDPFGDFGTSESTSISRRIIEPASEAEKRIQVKRRSGYRSW
jgi:hypothetical protein